MTREFKSNDKVYVRYHNIYLLTIFHLFQPPACGKIIGKHWKRKYNYLWGKDGICDWYWVKCVNCIFPILVPETCIDNLAESIEKDKRTVERLGVPDLLDNKRSFYEDFKNHQSKKELYLNQ